MGWELTSVGMKLVDLHQLWAGCRTLHSRHISCQIVLHRSSVSGRCEPR